MNLSYNKFIINMNFKYCIRKYKELYDFDLSYMKLKISSQPVFNDGSPCKYLKPEETGGSWTKLGYVQINPNIESVMDFYKIKLSKYKFNLIIIAHELAHEIYNNLCGEDFKRFILNKAKKENFHTVYLDHVPSKKKKEETFCEYLANTIVNH